MAIEVKLKYILLLPMDNMPSLEALRDSFNRVYNGPNRLQREYDLVKEAKRLNVDLDTYRRLYELREEKEYIDPYPKAKHWQEMPSAWTKWLLHLPKRKRLALLGKVRVRLLLQIFQSGLLITVLIGLSRYMWESPKRQKQAHYQAWQVVNMATGQRTSGGRIEALQDLNKDGVSLQGLNAKNANLQRINLKGAYLPMANLQNTEFRGANLQRSHLVNTELQDACLIEANLQNANLESAKLQRVWLTQANLKQANLRQADLSQARLWKANLQQASLNGAMLEDAELAETNLQEAWLQDTNLRKAQLGKAQLQKANLLYAFLEKAILRDANLQSAYLVKARLQGAKLNQANLKDTNLQDADLRSANLWKADLQGANLKGANIEGAYFEKTQNLTPSQVKAARNWQKAYYDPKFRKELGLPPDNLTEKEKFKLFYDY
ncbi:MAG: pentapeptide repeat-containing protein [Phormidium sp.]